MIQPGFLGEQDRKGLTALLGLKQEGDLKVLAGAALPRSTRRIGDREDSPSLRLAVIIFVLFRGPPCLFYVCHDM